jgi:hypothetical protein
VQPDVLLNLVVNVMKQNAGFGLLQESEVLADLSVRHAAALQPPDGNSK